MPTSLNQKFAPTLADLLSLDDLPAPLDVGGALAADVLDHLYYQNYRFTRTPHGDQGFYNLDVFVYRTVTLFKVAGTDLAVVLNPADDTGAASGTSFAVSASYRLDVLKYVPDFDIAGFDFSLASILDLLSTVFHVADAALVRATIETFIGDLENPPANTDPLQSFVDTYNASYAPQVTAFTDLEDAVGQIVAHHDVAEVVLNEYVAGDYENLRAILQLLVGDVSYASLLAMITPQVRASIRGIALAIEFPRELLQPLDADGNVVEAPALARLVFEAGDLTFDSATGIAFDPEASFSLAKAGILNTGLTLEVSNLRLFLTPGQNFYKGSDETQGYADFTGVYIGDATIGLPTFWKKDDGASTAEIKGWNILVGTGGFSGTVALAATSEEAPLLSTTLGGDDGFRLTLDAFDLTFEQNAVVASNIHGSLTIPGFDDPQGDPAEIDVDVALGQGGFEVTASSDTALKLIFPDILTIEITSLSIGSVDDRWYVEISGSLEITAAVPGIGGTLLPDSIELQKLRIYTDGTIELEGGSIILSTAMTLNAGPARISVTAIHFGSLEQEHEGKLRKYAYFGFDGGLSLDPGGVDARGDGIKLFFTTDQRGDAGLSLHVFLKIESIAIDLTIPGEAPPESAALLLSGYLSMKNPDPDAPGSAAGTEYSGGVAFSVPPVQIGGSAGMRLNPALPAFLIDVGLELAVPLPLGTTGLGIYGMRGLVGSNYVASKAAAGIADDGSWYDYYKAKISPDYKEGIQLSKFEQTGGFALGAGISLATAPDTGLAFSSKLFFLASLPDVLLLQGQAAILAQRVGLDVTEDPPFSALIAISGESIEAAFGIDYQIPEGGEILDIAGSAELGFFFKDASAWYVNLGRDTPEEKRIQATLLSLFKGYAFLMLSADGIVTGAGASWDFSKKYGPAEVSLGAYLDTGGEISFKPIQVGAFISLGGYAYVGLFKFKLGFTVSATLAAEAPRPFIVTGSFTLVVDIPKPFKDLEIGVDLSWTFESARNTDEIEFLDTSDVENRAPVQALNFVTGESFAVRYLGSAASVPAPDDWADYVIPIDSYVDIEFSKYVKPDASGVTMGRYGGVVGSPSYTELIPPRKGKSTQVKHEFHVRNVFIKFWDGTWKDYDIYTAMTPLEDLDDVSAADLADSYFGYWQLADGTDRYNKLRLLSRTPLSYATSGSGPRTIENFGITDVDLTCPEDEIEETCVDWEEVPLRTKYPSATTWYHDGVFLTVNPRSASVQRMLNPFGLRHALVIQQGGALDVTFREPVSSATFSITCLARSVRFSYFRKVEVANDPLSESIPVYEYELIGRQVVARRELVAPVQSSIDVPFDRVTIAGGPCPDDGGTLPGYFDEICTILRSYLERLRKACRVAEEAVQKLCCCRQKDCGTCCRCRQRGHDAGPGTPPGAADPVDVGTVPPGAVAGRAPARRGRRDDARAGERGPGRPAKNPPEGCGCCGCSDGKERAGGPVRDRACERAILLRDKICRLTKRVETFSELVCDGLLDQVLTRDPCAIYLHRICTLTVTAADYNENLPDQGDRTDETVAMIEALEKLLHPVWRPNTKFAVQIQTEDIVDGVSKGLRHYNFGFKSEGPVGWFHQFRSEYAALAAQDRAAEFKLASLKHYIDMGKSYPDPSGRLTGAKPMFYKGVELALVYKYGHAYMFYSGWDELGALDRVKSSLEIRIKDPTDLLSTPSLLTLSAGVAWHQHDQPTLSRELVTLDNLLSQGANCAERAPESFPGMLSVTKPEDLQPLKLYTALCIAKFTDSGKVARENTVHEYVFQTSRYATFQEQVESYKLVDDDGNEAQATFGVELGLTGQQVTNARAIVRQTMADTDPLVATFADRLDRLLYGALQMSALPAATGTEFNLLARAGTGALIGVLVRSPEPFNSPQLPDSVIAQTIAALNRRADGSGIDPDYVVLFARDLASAFVTNDAMSIPAGTLELTFAYYRYDGSDWVVRTPGTDLVTVPIEL